MKIKNDIPKGSIVRLDGKIYIVAESDIFGEHPRVILLSSTHYNSSTHCGVQKKTRCDACRGHKYEIEGWNYRDPVFVEPKQLCKKCNGTGEMPNPLHIDNIEFIADSMMNFINKCLIRLFE